MAPLDLESFPKLPSWHDNLTVELGVTQKASVFDAIVLMSLNVGENSREGEVAAIDLYGLEDIRVTALS